MMNQQEHVVIVGASTNRSKFGNKAVRAFLGEDAIVYPINPRESEIEGQTAYPTLSDLPDDVDYDRVLMYVPPAVGIGLLGEIKKLNAHEVWLNPGSESSELIQRAEEIGLPTITACSIIGIGHSPSEFPE
jgi:predicted CoA-binding protein